MKLARFKDKRQTNTRNIMIAFGVVISFLVAGYISKSYAIYKLEKKYDIIQSKVGTFKKGDVQVSVLVDGQEASSFPTYQDNYYVESIECTNGVNATFDVENWQINIADMASTSTKCIVSFDSTKHNDIMPINMSKSQLLALNTEISHATFNSMKAEMLDTIYPVGSIYFTATEDTVAKVEAKFGGEWEVYSSGKTLVGNDGTNYITGDAIKGSGGSSTVTLETANLPAHTHSISHTHTTPASTITSSGAHTHTTTAVNNVGSTTTNGSHVHTVGTLGSYGGKYGLIDSGNSGSSGVANSGWGGDHSHKLNIPALSIASSGAHTHTVPAMTTNSISTTTSGSTGSGTAFSIQNPYTVVYMYKRIS